MAADLSSEICVFSPGLRLTVTAENGPRGEEIHLHPGGQGYWLARSIERLGTPVVLCATVGGEVGDVLTPLLKSQTGIELIAVEQSAPSSVSMYDRRSGTRTLIARSEPSAIDRHAVDKLYSLTLAHAIGRGCCVLAGNIGTGVIPPAYYSRLCADLAAVGVPIITDVHGPELAAILDERSIQLVKVSDEDLREDGVVGDDSDQGLAAAVNDLADRAPHDLVVTRGPDHPAVARMDGRWYAVSPPRLAAVDWRGAGDAMAGAMAVAYLRGLSGADILRFGAAAGAASVTRRGLASLDS
ncbi:MAG: PfkB family carbohydrate kinase, partial [Ilumatobacteraceae bacterium]